MSIWKILGGIAIGVGAVAAAPFTGGGSVLAGVSLATSLAGAGAVTAAVAAGVVGGVVGSAVGDSEEEARKQGVREGRQQANAENLQKLQSLEEKLSRAIAKMKENSQHFRAIIAMQAVAVSVANCDGVICDAERADIELFISGVSASTLPDDVKKKIYNIYLYPLNIKEAFELASNSGLDMGIFDEIITLVMSSDNIIHSSEKEFVQAWNRLKVA